MLNGKIDPTKDKTSEFYQEKIVKLKDVVKVYKDNYQVKDSFVVYNSTKQMLGMIKKNQLDGRNEMEVTIRVMIDGVAKEILVTGMIRSVFIGDFK